MATSKPRLPAEQRRASLLKSACGCFATGSYHGTTTAEIASAAGVTEPILYRHFDSKRELYMACLDEMWRRIRSLWEEAVAAEPDPALWVSAMGRAFLQSERARPVISHLWVQAIAEATEDPEIRRYIKKHMREVHGYVSDVIRKSQEAGGINNELDADAEAWIFISLGLLSMADRALDGLMADKWPEIRTSRLKSLTGRTSFDTPSGE
jgi:AcrR family transcriptional regulator